jgi:succinyl-CoA synthetase alpha subunit/citrate synthase
MASMTNKPFPYGVGILSLEELVTRESRVCVINILGTESRKVTPVSHVYSGGNVVAGVQYGRHGALETEAGNIPVYHSVRDVMKHGHTFDIGVVYLPPAAVSQAVWELVRFNPDLKRIVIVTEKVSTRDSRNIRNICQNAGVDVIGANCLGVANAWDHVRVGGALGGDRPEETLIKGSVAIHSNSGNFTTTIAEYLKTGGFGISTAVSSGKDVYIHFALPEFLYAAQNDTRTQAVAAYVEPGGYYEKMALDWIADRTFGFSKPMVVCVAGRWKKNLERACGHAGAMAGSGDDAESKENWFDEYFGVPVFDPANPKAGKKGVRVSSLQHFPDAMRAVFNKIDEKPDFQASGDLSLKLWISDNWMPLPKSLELPVVRAIEPYDLKITEINKLVGAHCLRQNMRNKSGASRMDPKTQVAELHGKPVLELSKFSFEENAYFCLAKKTPSKAETHATGLLLQMFLRRHPFRMDRIQSARTNGCMPNAMLAAEVAALGDPFPVRKMRAICTAVIKRIREFGIEDNTASFPETFDASCASEFLEPRFGAADSAWIPVLMREIDAALPPTPAAVLCRHVRDLAQSKGLAIRDELEFFTGVLIVSLFWKPMLEKRITRETVEDTAAVLTVFACMAGYSVFDPGHNCFWKALTDDSNTSVSSSFTDDLFRILFNRDPAGTERAEFQCLLGLTATNGPGTLSAKGAKESVSARNVISTAFAGFLTHAGLAHGGNGFEAVEYLLERFEKSGLMNPGSQEDKTDLQALAVAAAKDYFKYKQAQKDQENPTYKRIPCINHPVFKGKDVNTDPREDFVRRELESLGIRNAFLEFYHHLVRELFNEGATENVFCVNVDAVLACVAVKLIWADLQAKRMSVAQVKDLVFVLFLIGRSIGTAAEIIDHRDRGEDMDCRTPQNEVSFVL